MEKNYIIIAWESTHEKFEVISFSEMFCVADVKEGLEMVMTKYRNENRNMSRMKFVVLPPVEMIDEILIPPVE